MSPKSLVRKYSGPAIEVSYDIRRCIHAEECTRGLREVFNRDKVPWIQPGGAEPERVAQVIRRCPTGALHYAADEDESPPKENTIQPISNGPLYVAGELEIVDEEGSVLHSDTRVALCRCGSSRNKPFCDNRHIEIEFHAQEYAPDAAVRDDQLKVGGKLQILSRENGPYAFNGAFALVGPHGQRKIQSESIALCRCGASNEKPFCDNTHRIVGFSAKGW